MWTAVTIISEGVLNRSASTHAVYAEAVQAAEQSWRGAYVVDDIGRVVHVAL